ncbi:hypothetical protein ACFYUV_35665 [Nonomuraea sp. NPDC003560]|uniref:hypothetical protein n=1 Tax=Nonomuraea sp. NPDC003560 TaxID=3364341 RepID=UPI0036AF09A3
MIVITGATGNGTANAKNAAAIALRNVLGFDISIPPSLLLSAEVVLQPISVRVKAYSMNRQSSGAPGAGGGPFSLG